jgi:hypothetical protein
MQASNFKHIIILAVIVAVLGGLYYAATYYDFFDKATKQAGAIEAETREIEQEIITQLEQIESIKLDAGIFQSEVFKSLEDRNVLLDDPETSRVNPFAPF